MSATRNGLDFLALWQNLWVKMALQDDRSRSSLVGHKGAPPGWARRMMSFSLWTVDCSSIRQSGTEWSPEVGLHFQAVLGRKQGAFCALASVFTHRFC
jgi:hypothetical protein